MQVARPLRSDRQSRRKRIDIEIPDNVEPFRFGFNDFFQRTDFLGLRCETPTYQTQPAGIVLAPGIPRDVIGIIRGRGECAAAKRTRSGSTETGQGNREEGEDGKNAYCLVCFARVFCTFSTRVVAVYGF